MLEEEVREEWRESCGDIRDSPVEEEIDIDVHKLVGECEEVEQLSVTNSVSVDRQAAEVREEDGD